MLAQLSHSKMQETEVQRNGNDLTKSTELAHGRNYKYPLKRNTKPMSLLLGAKAPNLALWPPSRRHSAHHQQLPEHSHTCSLWSHQRVLGDPRRAAVMTLACGHWGTAFAEGGILMLAFTGWIRFWNSGKGGGRRERKTAHTMHSLSERRERKEWYFTGRHK